MKRYFYLLILVLLLSSCASPFRPPECVEGIVSDVYVGLLTPAVSFGPYTFIKFSDGRVFVLKDASPQPIEKDRYHKIYYNSSDKKILRAEMTQPSRPKIPGEMQ
jgi:hypothetical protein